MSDATKAVFLSYASQDAEVARRICDALRTADVVVWFDQSELVGGDAWDTKIRKQIADCALFVPVISANTQSRLEGYFRLEWKLAANRTHTMAEERAFLLPVVVDGTRDADAKVPSEFRAVQWTRLPGGETTAAFVARVQKLVGGTNSTLPAAGPSVSAPPVVAPVAKSGLPPWIAIALGAAVLALIAYVVLRPTGKEVPSGALAKPVAEVKPAAPTPAPAPAAATTLGEKSIAVLPFANLSLEKENEFFADSLQDDIITSLAKVRDLAC